LQRGASSGFLGNRYNGLVDELDDSDAPCQLGRSVAADEPRRSEEPPNEPRRCEEHPNEPPNECREAATGSKRSSGESIDSLGMILCLQPASLMCLPYKGWRC
jgi:hypothetical protein